MPEYSYTCDAEDGGCGHYFTVVQKISEYKALKKCPQCNQDKLRRAYEDDIAYGSVKKSDGAITIGHLAERNTSRMSSSQRAELHAKHNAYKGSDSALPDGMKRVEKAKDKPWYRSSNQGDIKNMTDTQKMNYIRTGKKNG